MKDRWMNMGYEEDELKPYVEPEPDYKDLKRIGMHSSSLCSSSLKHVCSIFLITCARIFCFPAYLFEALQSPFLSSPS
jgi:hypothetical protein